MRKTITIQTILFLFLVGVVKISWNIWVGLELSRIADISSSVICFWLGLFISALANILNVLALTPALPPEGPGGPIDGPALGRGLTRGAEDLAAEVPERAVAN